MQTSCFWGLSLTIQRCEKSTELSASTSHHVAFKTLLNLDHMWMDSFMEHDDISEFVTAIFSWFQYTACNTFDTVHINGLQWMCHIIWDPAARVPQCPPWCHLGRSTPLGMSSLKDAGMSSAPATQPINHSVLQKWMSSITATHLVNCYVLRTCLPVFLPSQMHDCTINMNTAGPWPCFRCTCISHAILFQYLWYFQRPIR